MTTDVKLPQWLDDCIFGILGAKYCRSCSDMTVIDWDKNDVLNYLGTYFPRSFAEAYCIFSTLFKKYPQKWNDTDVLSVFDLGCGTGGEIIGMVTAMAELRPSIKTVRVCGLDGNNYALDMLEKVVDKLTPHLNVKIDLKIIPLVIEDFYDLDILNKVLNSEYDIFMCVKAICEFVTKDCFEKQNAYKHIVKFMLPKITEGGVLMLEDVTTYNNVSKEWLPKMMDKGLANVNGDVILKNDGFNQCFTVSHSQKQNDVSKVAWRIIQKI